MNLMGRRERSWRKGVKRGVSPIIATILLVAITVVLAAVLYILISGLTKAPGSTPLGTAYAPGKPAPYTGTTGCTAGDNCYSVSIQSAGSGLIYSNLAFQVKSPSGAIVTITKVTVLDANGGPVTAWTNSGGYLSGTVGGTTYSGSGATGVASTQTLIVDMGANSASSLSGGQFITLGTGTFSGTVATTLP